MPALTRAARSAICLIAMSAFTGGCGTFSCDNYMSYDEQLDTWLGHPLTNYESRLDVRPIATMERPQNRLEYTYNTPYVAYNGQQEYCRTYLEVDRATGSIERWRYEGDSCPYKGFCRD